MFRRAKFRHNLGTMLGGVGKISQKIALIPKCPGPNCGRRAIATHHICSVVSNISNGLTVGIAERLHWLTHQIRYRREVPKERWYQSNMVLLGAMDHSIEALEESLPIGEIHTLLGWPIASAH